MVEHRQELVYIITQITNGVNGVYALEKVFALLVMWKHNHAVMVEHRQEHAYLITNGVIGMYALVQKMKQIALPYTNRESFET